MKAGRGEGEPPAGVCRLGPRVAGAGRAGAPDARGPLPRPWTLTGFRASFRPCPRVSGILRGLQDPR